MVERRASSRASEVCVVALLLCLLPPHDLTFAQQLLDRVVARVNGVAITQSDVNAMTGLGVVDGDAAAATQAAIDRQLMLTEIARFTPPEPDAAAIDREVAERKVHAGANLPALMEATGIDEARIRDLARDSIRIRQYLDERFGTAAQVSDDDADRYYREHPGEFSRNGVLIPFEEAAPVARQRAAALRRSATIDQWLRDLRGRADIAIPNR